MASQNLTHLHQMPSCFGRLSNFCPRGHPGATLDIICGEAFDCLEALTALIPRWGYSCAL